MDVLDKRPGVPVMDAGLIFMIPVAGTIVEKNHLVILCRGYQYHWPSRGDFVTGCTASLS